MSERTIFLPCPCGTVHQARDPGRAVRVNCPGGEGKIDYECHADGPYPLLRLCGETQDATLPRQWRLAQGTSELGRTAAAIRINHPGLSRTHCAFHVSDRGCELEDLNSRNGTFLNEKRLAPGQRVPLTGGDLVRVSSFHLRYLCPTGTVLASATGTQTTTAEEEGPDPLIGETIDAFRITGVLAEGGGGRIYTAVREEDGLDCVVKTVLPGTGPSRTATERFIREMEMAKLLDHPYIVTPLGGGERDGCLYMAMERFDGVNLRKRFSGRPAPVKGVILIARQIVSALAHAHDKKIVHRDIKPENILADRKGRTKILDFGIAKLLEDDELCALTLARGILGTPGYMAPEQVDNPKRVDPRSDIYSLGCTLYFCLAGRSPHTGESPVEIIHSSRTNVPDIREARQETPPPLADLVTRCMAPDPGDRPQTASAVQFALENMEV